MEARKQRDVTIELCAKCGGVWLDAGEFDALIAERFRGEPLEQFFETQAQIPLEPAACPVDKSAMQVISFETLELDRCPRCAGIWIDGAERQELPQAAQNVEVESAPEVVVCGGCAAEVPSRTCMQRMDAYWCENCVVSGNYPGSHGRPVTSQMADALQAYGDAVAEQGRRKEKIARRKEMRERLRNRGLLLSSGNRFQQRLLLEAIHAAANYIGDWLSERRDPEEQ